MAPLTAERLSLRPAACPPYFSDISTDPYLPPYVQTYIPTYTYVPTYVLIKKIYPFSQRDRPKP